MEHGCTIEMIYLDITMQSIIQLVTEDFHHSSIEVTLKPKGRVSSRRVVECRSDMKGKREMKCLSGINR